MGLFLALSSKWCSPLPARSGQVKRAQHGQCSFDGCCNVAHAAYRKERGMQCLFDAACTLVLVHDRSCCSPAAVNVCVGMPAVRMWMSARRWQQWSAGWFRRLRKTLRCLQALTGEEEAAPRAAAAWCVVLVVVDQRVSDMNMGRFDCHRVPDKVHGCCSLSCMAACCCLAWCSDVQGILGCELLFATCQL